MASVPQTVGDKQLVTLGGDDRIEIISAGGLRQVVTLQQIADFIGGGPVTVTSVPNGGTGLSSITLNGVMFGNGTNPVGVTIAGAEGSVLVAGPSGVPQWLAGVGTADQVLTSNGTGTLPTWEDAAGGTYPPLPVPDMQAFLQAGADANTLVDWIWGDYEVPAPILVSVSVNTNDIGCDFHGAVLTPGFNNTALDLITYTVPNTSPDQTQIAGLQLRNLTIFGGQHCRSGLVVSAPSHANGIYGVEINNVSTHDCFKSGLLFYGAVFEADIIGHFARNNVFAGIELRNPNQSGGGVISSVNIFGGDLRVQGAGGGGNGYGLALTADISFQEPAGVHVFATNFIANASAGIVAPSGIAQVIGCHFENNCSNNGSETDGAVWISGGGASNLMVCDAAHSTANGQTCLLRTVGGGLDHSYHYIYACYSFDEELGTGDPTVKTTGNGTVYADGRNAPSVFTGTGGWALRITGTVDGVF